MLRRRSPARRKEGRRGWRSAFQGRGESATDTCLQGSAWCARRARSGPPPAGGVGGGPRLALPAPPPAPPPGEAPHRPGPAPAPRGRGEGAGLSLASPEEGSAPQWRALSGRPVSSPVSPPGLFLAAAASLEHIHSHTQNNTQTHSCDSGDLKTPHAEVTLPGLPRPFLLLPQRGAWSSREWGGEPRRRDGERSGWALGWRLRAGVSGPDFLGSRGETRSGAVWIASGPGPCFPPREQAGGLLCVGCCLPGLFFLTSPTRVLTVCSLYFSAFPSSPDGRRGTARAPPPHATPDPADGLLR